jgi:FHA domain
MNEKIYLGVLEDNSKAYYVVACTLPVQIGKLHTEENQILLDPVYDRVSRVHGVIESVPGRGMFYLDRSSNGTHVGALVLRNARTALAPGFELRIENYVVTHLQQKPLLVIHTDRKLTIQAHRELLPGRGLGIKHDAEGCRLADLNRWTEWREPAIARIELQGKQPQLVVADGRSGGATNVKLLVNKSPVRSGSRDLHATDVVEIDNERFEILSPGQHHVICGNAACQLINPPGFEANCKWCGFYLASTGGTTRTV